MAGQAEETTQPPAAQNVTGTFPIVAIGASAGGFEAFRDILRNVPADLGMALVLIQHLDPTHESQLSPLLARVTEMPVSEARDMQQVEPNNVYVIPPHSQMRIKNGTLRLEPRSGSRGQPTTIDQFMRSLAEDWGDQAIGVVLSGTLSDGTLGLQEIKAAGGFTFAQDLETAKYLEMPRAAIQAGHVDFVLEPKKIADELYRLGQRLPLTNSHVMEAESQDMGALEQLFAVVRNRTGVDFTHYKRSTLNRRIQRRMTAKRMDTLEQYVSHVRSTPDEARALYEEILIHVTRFFRDKELYEGLERLVFPRLHDRDDKNEEIRIWVAGCATGEEAYSVAIAIHEYQAKHNLHRPVQVFATDLSDTAIATARTGRYPTTIAQDVPEEILGRHFINLDGGYQISKAIRAMCVFAVQDLTRDPPFSNMDLVLCRNVLIYMESPNQKRVLAVLHYALKNEGFLALGTSETPNRLPDLFTEVDKKSALYSKNSVRLSPIHELSHTQQQRIEDRPASRSPASRWNKNDLERESDHALLEHYGPPAVVLNDQFEAVQFRGDGSRFVNPQSGPASFSIMKMARQGLSIEIHAAIQECQSSGKPASRRHVRFDAPDGLGLARIDVHPLKGPTKHDRYFLVVFRDDPIMPQPAKASSLWDRVFGGGAQSEQLRQALEQTEHELDATKQYLRNMVEDYDTTTEELRCANEEALSSNEELQSTNEELETAKEEAQSTNEELRTLNEELIHRSMEIQKANNDLTNLLNSVDIAIVMLGRSMVIRRFTPRAQRLLNLIPTDLGRPITHINSPFEGIDLKAEIEKVLHTLQVRRIKAMDGDGRDVRIDIHPYRTSDDQIDGTVLVVTEAKTDPE